MGDAGLLGQIFSVFSVPAAAWAATCIVAVHLYRARNESKRDTAQEKEGDWTRLRAEIARLDKRCDHLQKEVDECREREGEWMRRAIGAEAASEGMGEVRQVAQRIVSADREGRKPGNGDG